MTDRQSSTETIIAALDILARDIHSEDGAANAAIAEGAQRLRELSAEVEALRSERDAAFSMTRCECDVEEACCNLVQWAERAESAEREVDALRAERDAAVAAERERCAKLCDAIHARHIAEYGDYIGETYAAECARAIRA
jgi:hypothetical protein